MTGAKLIMDCISLIGAADDNMAIGSRGTMPWHISADLQYFKRVTFGHTVIMGRLTWESVGCRPLQGRRNIVVTKSAEEAMGSTEGVEFVRSLEEALLSATGDGEIFIIGGGTLYRQMIQRAEKIYLTKVHTSAVGADTFFPYIDPDQWWETSRSSVMNDDASGLKFEFVVYDRIG